MAIEYAMYRGDEFIDIGTIDELADKYYKKRELLAYLSKESTHEKMKNDDTQLLLYKSKRKAGDRMTVATREKCPCCDFDSYGFGKNIIGKGYGSCEIRLYRATKYDFYIYSYSVGAEALLKDWFEIYSQKVRFCPVCGRRLAID